MIQQWSQETGATVFGGCCGIGPDHIRAVSNWKKKDTKGSLPPLGGGDSIPQPTTSAVVSRVCRILGCGCGVQIGFGQAVPFLCGAISAPENTDANQTSQT